MLLNDVGYARPRVGLFESFLGDVLRTSFSSAGSGSSEPLSATLLERGGATLRSVRRLYALEPYRMPTESGLEDGGALMSYVSHVFEDWGVDAGIGIDSSQLGGFLSELLDGRRPSEDELKEVRSPVPRRVRGGGELCSSFLCIFGMRRIRRRSFPFDVLFSAHCFPRKQSLYTGTHLLVLPPRTKMKGDRDIGRQRRRQD